MLRTPALGQYRCQQCDSQELLAGNPALPLRNPIAIRSTARCRVSTTTCGLPSAGRRGSGGWCAASDGEPLRSRRSRSATRRRAASGEFAPDGCIRGVLRPARGRVDTHGIFRRPALSPCRVGRRGSGGGRPRGRAGWCAALGFGFPTLPASPAGSRCAPPAGARPRGSGPARLWRRGRSRRRRRHSRSSATAPLAGLTTNDGERSSCSGHRPFRPRPLGGVLGCDFLDAGVVADLPDGVAVDARHRGLLALSAVLLSGATSAAPVRALPPRGPLKMGAPAASSRPGLTASSCPPFRLVLVTAALANRSAGRRPPARSRPRCAACRQRSRSCPAAAGRS